MHNLSTDLPITFMTEARHYGRHWHRVLSSDVAIELKASESCFNIHLFPRIQVIICFWHIHLNSILYISDSRIQELVPMVGSNDPSWSQ